MFFLKNNFFLGKFNGAMTVHQKLTIKMTIGQRDEEYNAVSLASWKFEPFITPLPM
jgi:hypothetical protein